QNQRTTIAQHRCPFPATGNPRCPPRLHINKSTDESRFIVLIALGARVVKARIPEMRDRSMVWEDTTCACLPSAISLTSGREMAEERQERIAVFAGWRERRRDRGTERCHLLPSLSLRQLTTH